MANTRKVVQIFLASPGDLQTERQTAKAVVDAFNKRWADWFDIQIELIGWEDTFKRFGRPQAQINLDLDRCEAFVGVMWRKWGTPPGGSYTSGFEEEFERALKSRKKSARPEMTLFFKRIDDEFLKDQGPDLKKVLAFRQRVIDEQQILFHDFDAAKDFEDKLTDWLTHYIKHLKRREDTNSVTEERAVSAEGGAKKTETQSTGYTPLSTEGAQFVRHLVSKTERDQEAHPILPVEVARLRLLATMIGTSGNDDNSLGTHDANLMFAERETLTLSRREMLALVDCGLDNISNETVPLWHWYAATNSHGDGHLSLATLVGSQSRRVGALGAMRLIGEHIKPLPPIEGDEKTGFPRKMFIRSWLSATGERIKAAALEYLASCGDPDDIDIVRAEFDKRNYQTVGAAADAIMRISLRQSREKALRALVELQPENVDVDLIDAIFTKPGSLATTLLLECATHRNGKVRSRVVQILATRNALPSELAEKLLEDSEALVRFEALRWLERDGREFSEDKAKAVLIKPTRPYGVGFGGLLGYPPTPSDKEGEALWNRFSNAKLRNLPATALDENGDAQILIEPKARFALDFKLFRQRSMALRAAIDDRFHAEFNRGVAALEKLGVNSESLNKIRSREESMRKDWLRMGADVLCEKAEPEDLFRIRQVVSDASVSFSMMDIEYLGTHGEWEDIGLLISLLDRPDASSTILSGPFDNDKMQAIADAIYKVGKGRFPELCKQEMPHRLLWRVISCAADKDTVDLIDSELMELFKAESVDVRKAILLKSVKALSKTRLRKLLAMQMTQPGSRYYNVSYWLDLGISLSRKQVNHLLDVANRKRR
jgi:hypothetical protein